MSQLTIINITSLGSCLFQLFHTISKLTKLLTNPFIALLFRIKIQKINYLVRDMDLFLYSYETHWGGIVSEVAFKFLFRYGFTNFFEKFLIKKLKVDKDRH